MLENLAVHARKRGAFPLTLYTSDRLEQRLFFDVPEKYDSQVDAALLAMIEMIDVVIQVSNGRIENPLAGADPNRIAARGKADEAIGQAIFRNNLRSLELGNNLYPTPWRAERYAMSEDALATAFWQGVNLDYGVLQARATQVKAAVAAANGVHITNPNGTDLTLRVQGQPVFASDGVLTDEEIRQGGAALGIYLPAGEVYNARWRARQTALSSTRATTSRAKRSTTSR